MRVNVDMHRCARHGQCTIVAPAVFTITEDNELVYASDVDESLRDLVEEAADVCPTAAITIGE